MYGVVWNNWIKERDAHGNEIVVPSMFVTFGVKHMKLWQLGRDSVGREGVPSVCLILCAAYVQLAMLVRDIRVSLSCQWNRRLQVLLLPQRHSDTSHCLLPATEALLMFMCLMVHPVLPGII